MMDSRYGAFLKSYNSGNQFFDKLAENFFTKIKIDLFTIINGSDPALSQKFDFISKITDDKTQNSYDKIVTVISVLDDPSILSNVQYKKNIANITYNLLDVASSSADTYLIDKIYNIAAQVVPATN